MNFNKAYKRADFFKFLDGFLPDDFKPKDTAINKDLSLKYTKNIHDLGAVPSLKNLKILEITHESEHDPRVSITREIFKILQRNGDQHALVAFCSNETDNYRLSYVRMQPTITAGKLEVEKSNPRRYSFFLGPDAKINTPERFLKREGKVNSVDDLQSRFAVEVVTEEFYERYRDLYERLVSHLEDDQTFQNVANQNNINESTFAKKLLSQIVFLYFIQRKGWLGAKKGDSVASGDGNFMRNLFHQADKKGENFFNNYLEYLFYDSLNKSPSRAGNFYRDKFDCQIPFLNGGLFEPVNDYDWENEFFHIPNKFFSDAENPENGGGALDIFDTYNFTIAEDDPIDVEVSVDPEMLGKVFENLLEENIQKGLGTFYTPRIVVNFMCVDSLAQYIYEETSFNKSKTFQLVDYATQNTGDKPEMSDEEIDSILEIIDDMKVCDPACGSGAFLIGMLQHITHLKRNLVEMRDGAKTAESIDEYMLKKQVIENSLYGVDVDAGAVDTSMLRLWLSLVVDYDVEDVEPLPNLDYKIKQGNSLVDTVAGEKVYTPTTTEAGMFVDEEKQAKEERLIECEHNYSKINDPAKKKDAQIEITNLTKWLLSYNMQETLDRNEKENKENKRKANMFKKESRDKFFKSLSIATKDMHELEEALDAIGNPKKEKNFFVWELEFLEIFHNQGGFDVVIANPPYGGEKVSNDTKKSYGLGSKDMYGVFIAASRSYAKKGGTVSYITSDTWLTIGSYFKLREKILENTFHYVMRLHADTFDAMVNVCAFSYTNKEPGLDNQLIAADLTQIPTRQDQGTFRKLIRDLPSLVGISTPTHAVYQYPQAFIQTNSNLPIFIASPKLFRLMNDTDAPKQKRKLEGVDGRVPVREIMINDQTVELVKLGDIAEVKQGLATGDNDSYIFQTPESGSRYRNIESYREYVLTDEDLERIAGDEAVRQKVIENGIHKSKDEDGFDKDRWFENRYIVPYDKGGKSDTDTGWLPNYYVPTDYFIDWSSWAVDRMLTMTIADRKRENEEEVTDPKHEKQIAAVFRNTDFYFQEGLTLSYTGMYAPNLRLNSKAVFDVGGSCIFPAIKNNQVLGNFVGKIVKYFAKNYIDHTVNFQVDENKELPILFAENSQIIGLVDKIIKKQQEEPRYNYAENEQKEIDRLVYEMYGLNEADIQEVETWYARRYPKLANHADIQGTK